MVIILIPSKYYQRNSTSLRNILVSILSKLIENYIEESVYLLKLFWYLSRVTLRRENHLRIDEELKYIYFLSLSYCQGTRRGNEALILNARSKVKAKTKDKETRKNRGCEQPLRGCRLNVGCRIMTRLITRLTP